jgi:hypothetical protein
VKEDAEDTDSNVTDAAQRQTVRNTNAEGERSCCFFFSRHDREIVMMVTQCEVTSREPVHNAQARSENEGLPALGRRPHRRQTLKRLEVTSTQRTVNPQEYHAYRSSLVSVIHAMKQRLTS